MSEQKGQYKTESKSDLTKEQILSWSCSLPFRDVDYQAPKPEQVAALIVFAGWSQVEAAKIIGVSYTAGKGSSAIRRYKSAANMESTRAIPYAAWRLMLLNAGVINIEDEIAQFATEKAGLKTLAD